MLVKGATGIIHKTVVITDEFISAKNMEMQSALSYEA